MKNFNEFINESNKRFKSVRTLKLLPPEQKLRYGCMYNILWLIKLAIEEGVNIHNNDIAILISSNYGYVETVEYLLDNGVDVHLNDDYLLRFACNNGELEIVKLLLKYGADIHVQHDKPLRWASEKGHYEVVKYLIEKGADVHARNDMALKLAIDNKHMDVVKLLKSYTRINESVRDKMIPKSKEDIDKTLKDYSPNKILELGYRNKMWDLVKRGIEEGANIHINGDSSIRVACFNGELELVKYLVDKGADIHIHEEDCLVKACYSGNVELVKYLVDKGADIHSGGIEKVLRAACSQGHPKIVKYLLDKGADERKITGSAVTFNDNRKEILDILNKYKKQ